MSAYKLESFDDSSWKRVLKDNKFFSLCANEEEALRSVWIEEGRKHDSFFVSDDDGVISEIDRGVL